MKSIIETKDYDFLREDERLADNIILLGYGGSYAYGTNIEGSDIDIRGCALNSKREILLGRGFEQIEDKRTDTVIYSLKKIVSLLTNCNPNVIEILGLKPEHYFIISKEGKELLDNKQLFLSQRAVKSFGGYANQQLHRLLNGSSDERLAEVGMRNRKAIRHNKLAKHSMHLVRLMYMCLDILEKGIIKTYRDEEHDLLMRLRNGEFLDESGKPTTDFFYLFGELQTRFEYAKKNTFLPKHPDMKKIDDLVIYLHSCVLFSK